MQFATQRRLAEELGIDAELEFVYKFSYQAKFNDAGSENELCSVYLGSCDQALRPNQTEVAAARFVSIGDLHEEMDANPERFTPWFKMEWQCLQTEYADQLRGYSAG